jgi:hypothetical protein
VQNGGCVIGWNLVQKSTGGNEASGKNVVIDTPVYKLLREKGGKYLKSGKKKIRKVAFL